MDGDNSSGTCSSALTKETPATYENWEEVSSKAPKYIPSQNDE